MDMAALRQNSLEADRELRLYTRRDMQATKLHSLKHLDLPYLRDILPLCL